MEMRQFDYPVSFRSLTGTLISEFSSIQYCFSLVLLYRMKILGYSTWSFLLLIVVREDQRTNVGIFLVVCSVSLPIMHLGTGEITTKQVWGPAELPETALGQNAINHLTIIGSLSLVDHSDTQVSSMLLSYNARRITVFSISQWIVTVVNAHSCLWGRLGVRFMGYSWTLLQDLSEGNSFSFSTRSLWVYEQVRSRNEVRGFHSLVSLIFSLFFSNSSHVSGYKFFQQYR